MARRKRRTYKTRSSGRSSYYKAKPRRRKSYGKTKLFQPFAMAYGGVRGFISETIDSVAPTIPVLNQIWQVSDEAVIGVGDYFVANSKLPAAIKKAAADGLVVENARAGETLRMMLMGGGNNNKNSSAQLYG